MTRFVLSLDEGTTSARAAVFSEEAELVGFGQYEFPQFFPRPGWVEQDPEAIWEAQLKAIRDALRTAKVEPSQISAVGVTNQRETTVVWDARTGRPVYNAIVWQDRRTAKFTDELRNNYAEFFKERTGLIPDPYFSASKLIWLLDNVPGLREKAEKGDVKFGTIDTYLIWKLTGGKAHVTDYSNASRTMLFNLRRLEWDDDIVELLKVPQSILPEPLPSSWNYGDAVEGVGAPVPVSGDAGDQQAALFGQAAMSPGEVKSTYGTGNFVLMNLGFDPVKSKDLLTTIAWGLDKRRVSYALEGSVFATGAAVQWLRDGLKILDRSDEVESLASTSRDNEGVYFVPAFVGLGTPYWDPYARGVIVGITRGTSRSTIARATLESIAYQTRDVIEVMEKDSGAKISRLKVDGGATRDRLLMQFQADVLGVPVVRPKVLETTALGSAFLAGLAVDLWSLEDIVGKWKPEATFYPTMLEERREKLYRGWKEAVKRSLGWARVVEGEQAP
ncbi:glycerol kinase [Sulfodiicoccus acidiphilus]|uniref:Glycerol kinase n=1 Tax=Sulfodiicoccus acidiphilus TaxID=1670455 RepID=A0A348B1X2_9CREN|nr:glycerol kinase GlpK [Sulfodiicoccus acidiphilus]BBD72174.1 glycerol kinase [Sulfodiicoccus acidiphilus]GGT94462.1 glycerol kinase [Sulfodiicoccus acidiphilus]